MELRVDVVSHWRLQSFPAVLAIPAHAAKPGTTGRERAGGCLLGGWPTLVEALGLAQPREVKPFSCPPPPPVCFVWKLVNEIYVAA